MWAEHEFCALKEFTDLSVDLNPQEPMLTFDNTELLFKNLDAAILCLPNKKKMLKKKKASPPLKQTSDTKMTDTKDDTEETVLKTAVCNTPLNRKRRNSLNSLLTPRQSANISSLKSLISVIEADVAELKNASFNSRFDNHLSLLEDKITQMGNSTKEESQKLNSKMLDLETENESLKMENAKLKLESSKLRSEIKSNLLNLK